MLNADIQHVTCVSCVLAYWACERLEALGSRVAFGRSGSGQSVCQASRVRQGTSRYGTSGHSFVELDFGEAGPFFFLVWFC